MRTKLLRGTDGSTMVAFYPATKGDHGRALETIEGRSVAGGRGVRGAGPEVDGPVYRGGFVVTTASQRARWGLSDLTAGGGARVVDEPEALGLLSAGALGPLAAGESAGEAPAAGDEVSCDGALEALRALVAPGARVDDVLDDLEDGELPCAVRRKVGRALRRALRSHATPIDAALRRAAMVLSLPWQTRAPERFDAAVVAQALDRSHGGLAQVKKRLIEVLAGCGQTHGLLTVEGARRGTGMAAGPGRGRHSRGVVRRTMRAAARARAVHPEARHPAATRQLLPRGPRVDLRVRLLPCSCADSATIWRITGRGATPSSPSRAVDGPRAASGPGRTVPTSTTTAATRTRTLRT